MHPIYCCLTNHPTSQWLKIIIPCYPSYFCGITELSWATVFQDFMQSLYKRLERETLDDPIVVGIPMASSLVSASLAGIAGTSGVWLGLSSLSGSSPQASLGFLQAWQLPSSWIPCMATFFPSRGSSKGTKWKLQSFSWSSLRSHAVSLPWILLVKSELQDQSRFKERGLYKGVNSKPCDSMRDHLRRLANRKQVQI